MNESGSPRQALRKNLSVRYFFVLFILLFPSIAHAWEIQSFNTKVIVREDSTAFISETIVVDFQGEQRHGIFRDIPLHYVDRFGQHYKMRLRVLGVSNEAAQPWSYTLESPGGGYLRIRIGDADVTLSGIQTYQIFYEVQRGAVRFFPDHDECYWNMTGNEWAVPIHHAHGEIDLPKNLSSKPRVAAYVGSFGAKTPLESIQVDQNIVVFDVPYILSTYEGLTAAVAWDKGIVREPGRLQNIKWWIEDNWIYGIPIFILFGIILLWRVKGRDPEINQSTMVEYAPPQGLTPAEVGTLIDEKVDMRDITATVIDLAVRGYLRIESFEKNNYMLTSLKPWEVDSDLKLHEKKILAGIFEVPLAAVTLAALDQVFYQYLDGVRSSLYNGLVKDGYFDSSPQTVRTSYFFVGILVGIGIFITLNALNSQLQMPAANFFIPSILSGLILMVAGRFMPRRTFKGAKLLAETKGFLEFLRRTDQDKIKRMNDPSLFERCLPYAMAFGVAAQWARAFEGIYTQPPQWYVGQWNDFSPMGFSHDLDRATSTMSQTFVTQPRSSSSSGFGSGGGGGFSGGGGGGGGGGAW